MKPDRDDPPGSGWDEWTVLLVLVGLAVFLTLTFDLWIPYTFSER